MYTQQEYPLYIFLSQVFITYIVPWNRKMDQRIQNAMVINYKHGDNILNYDCCPINLNFKFEFKITYDKRLFKYSNIVCYYNQY